MPTSTTPRLLTPNESAELIARLGGQPFFFCSSGISSNQFLPLELSGWNYFNGRECRNHLLVKQKTEYTTKTTKEF